MLVESEALLGETVLLARVLRRWVSSMALSVYELLWDPSSRFLMPYPRAVLLNLPDPAPFNTVPGVAVTLQA